MSKLLNQLKKTPLIGVRSASPVGPNTYEPPTPRVALALAGVAMTVITMAVSVILPAQMDPASREPRMFAASNATAPASMGHATVTSIEVVSTRERGTSTVPARIGEAEPQPGRLGKTTWPAVVRVSTTTRDPVD